MTRQSRTALTSATLGLALFGMLGCGGGQPGGGEAETKPAPKSGNETGLSPAEVRQISNDAFVYGFPMVASYNTLYRQVVDTTDHDYRSPFNVIASASDVATPEDKFVVTPNSDTPYSFLWMDLRAEPIVVTLPKIEKGRYYSGQLIDLYTFNFAYLGTRAYGNNGGNYLVTGPGWKGETPKDVQAVIPCETQFAYLLIRTQLFNPADIENVRKIQTGYHAQPLSKFLGTPAPPAAPAVSWPKPTKETATTPRLFNLLSFLLQFCPTAPSEQDLMKRFAKLGIGAGLHFDPDSLTPELQNAVDQGIAASRGQLAGVQKQIDEDALSASDLFGTRESLKDNYLRRFAGATLGLYGNSAAEAIYLGYFVDANQKPCDTSKASYTLRFPEGQLPPAEAFWSLTMYDGKTQFLVANPLKRYLLNSPMAKSFVYDRDGSLTLYVRKDSPGKKLEANWLPAPNGPFYAILRIYLPGPAVVDGTWKKPGLVAGG